jgi:hypothetical protein
MPFKSQAQRRACYAAKDPNWNCKEWESETPNKKLPERLSKKADARMGDRVKARLYKQAVQQVTQQLIPGAPPVPKIVPAGQQPQAQQAPTRPTNQPAAPTQTAPVPAANGVPQQPQAATPTLPTAKDVLKNGPLQRPGAPQNPLTNSEAVIANRLSKMASTLAKNSLSK